MNKPRWRWGNVPTPEVYVVLLAVGVLIHFFVPLRVFPSSGVGHALGWPVMLAGLLLTAWAVFAAATTDIGQPTEVVASGPYCFSRNPMYVGRTLIALGIGLIGNAGWVLMLVPVAALFTHLVIIPGEERSMEQRFGQNYLSYKEKVRRRL